MYFVYFDHFIIKSDTFSPLCLFKGSDPTCKLGLISGVLEQFWPNAFPGANSD